jgi:hypothetical protein
MVIKRIGPVSCAKIAGILYVVLGLIFGAIFSMASLAGALASDTPGSAGIGALVGAGSIVIFPILYGCFGFVMTLIMAWLYNVVAGVVGGVELDLQ